MIQYINQVTDEFWNNKRVFVRVDFNIPINELGEITDDTRITSSLPTIQYLVQRGAKVVLASHLGRPRGKPRKALSLEPIAVKLQALLGQEIIFTEECVGEGLKRLSEEMKKGSVMLLENLRFHSGEEKDDADFSKQLKALGDVYVNDAFGCSHRAHASVHALPALFEKRLGGFLIQDETEHLKKLLYTPKTPYVAILGGAKVKDKVGVVAQLLDRVNTLLVGGAMAYTFLKAKGQSVGSSPVEEDSLVLAKSLIQKAQHRGVEFLLPIDHVVGTEFSKNAAFQVQEGGFLAPLMGLDIGPKTCDLFESHLLKAQTVFWNGPMGVCEWPPFAQGTHRVMQAVCANGGYKVVGGGDSLAALKQAGLVGQVSFASTGGGASLEFVEGKLLPGLKAIGYEG